MSVQLGLAKTHVSETLTNPIYTGRLRTGEQAGVAPIVDAHLWNRVQEARERRRTRTPGRFVKRRYALRLRCSACGRFLYGDYGRYRHPLPTCPGFLEAMPHLRRRRVNTRDTRMKGHSYPQAWYEDAVGELFGSLGRLDDAAIAEVVRRLGERPPQVDQLALARINRAREDAARELARTRDVTAWQATMSRLDAEEQWAREPVEQRRLTSQEIVRYLRSLPSLWRDSGPEGRQALVGAIFKRTDVLGFQKLEYELTPDAIDLGLGAALPSELDLSVQIGGFVRGESIGTSDRIGPNDARCQAAPRPDRMP